MIIIYWSIDFKGKDFLELLQRERGIFIVSAPCTDLLFISAIYTLILATHLRTCSRVCCCIAASVEDHL